MKVKFKDENSILSEYSIIYETENSEPEMAFDEVKKDYCYCYFLKGLGWVDEIFLEIVNEEKENDVSAVDVFIELNKL